MATTATVNSKVFDTAIKAANPEISITSVAAPKLHEYAESSLDLILNAPTQDIKECVIEYVEPFINAGCDTILLACTHFPPYEALIRDVVGSAVNIIAPSVNTAEALRATLKENKLTNTSSSNQAETQTSESLTSKGKLGFVNNNFEIISTAGNNEKYKKFSEMIL